MLLLQIKVVKNLFISAKTLMASTVSTFLKIKKFPTTFIHRNKKIDFQLPTVGDGDGVWVKGQVSEDETSFTSRY